MIQSINWRYHRLNCNSCAKAEAFLTTAGIQTLQQVNARKVSIPREEALLLLSDVQTLWVINGKKIYEIKLLEARPSDDEICDLIIGRSGSLRAPALKFAQTLVVGFDESLYHRLLVPEHGPANVG